MKPDDMKGYCINVCGCQHERWSRVWDFDATVQVVKNCVFRNGGKNLLCAHNDMFPTDADPFTDLIKKASQVQNFDEIQELEYLRWINATVDNLVRASYIHGSYRAVTNVVPDTEVWTETRAALGQLKQILDNSVDKGVGLNQGQRINFNRLVREVQKRSKHILELMLEENQA